MPYVQRNDSGKITRVFANPQDYAQELIDDSAQELMDFYNPMKTASDLWKDYQSKAQFQLDANDKVAIRCIKAGVPYTADWLENDEALRAILRTPSGDPTLPFPVPPATFPAGS